MPRKITKIFSSAKQRIGLSSKKPTGVGHAKVDHDVGCTEDEDSSTMLVISDELAESNPLCNSPRQHLLDERRSDSEDKLASDDGQSDPNMQQNQSIERDGAGVAPAGDDGNSNVGVSNTSGLRRFFSFGTGAALTSASGYNELFSEQKELNQNSWWQSNFNFGTRTPILFGTWDGVFVTCVVHLFGVISFLRVGWLVGNEGIILSVAVVFGCFLFTTVSLLAAIGIIERCAAATSGEFYGAMQRFDPEYPSTVASARANVHILISTVLGSRIGGAISLVYCFGQAVSCALHVTGFTETFVQLCALLIQRHLEPLEPNNTGGKNVTESTGTFVRSLARLLMIEIDGKHGTNTEPSGTSSPTTTTMSITLTPYTYQIVSTIIIVILFFFNIIGVKCLFRLQSVLFCALVLAIGDFTWGLFQTHPDYGYGPIVASMEHLNTNLYPNYPNLSLDFWRCLFQSVGVFFPATIGVMAGVNMGSDLQTPNRSIPVGSFSAIISSYVLHVLFIIGLGVTCTRMALLNDYSVSQHVSALGLFFMLGLYMSAVSSSLGSMYTAPRIMQNLAQELHSFPVLKCFASGKGPNKIPINALIFFTLLTLTFVMIGGINVLAPIVTIPYLLTYATIEYAYFSMAMTFDIQISREKRFMAIATQLRNDSPEDDDDGEKESKKQSSDVKGATTSDLVKSPNQLSKPFEPDTVSLSPSVGPGAVPPSPTPSMQQHLAGYGSVQSITQHIKIKRRQSTKSSSGSDSDSDGDVDDTLKRMAKLAAKNSKLSEQQAKQENKQETKQETKPTKSTKTKTIRQLMAAVSDDEDDDDDDGGEQASSVFLFDNTSTHSAGNVSTTIHRHYSQSLHNEQSERLLNPDPELAEIACKQEIWYLRVMNRWIVLIAALLKVVLMFTIAWHYALITIGAFLILYMIIGRTNPGFYPGVSEFIFSAWIKNFQQKILGRKSYLSFDNSAPNMVASYSYDRIVLPPTSIPNLNYQSDQLTKENSDYCTRQPFHYSTTINPQFND